jgi:hypothetical protein
MLSNPIPIEDPPGMDSGAAGNPPLLCAPPPLAALLLP